MTIEARIIADSLAPNGVRLTTFQLKFPRIVLSEFNTHRVFCLAGDARLDFDLPRGGRGGSNRRVHSMSLREFADKWINGAAEGVSPKHNGRTLDHLDAATIYSAREIAVELGFKNAMSLNKLCRDGVIIGARKRGQEWVAYGRHWMTWRQSTGTRRFSLQSRLSKMQIRQINEHTGEIQTSTVKNVVVSGIKEVFRVSAGSFSVCGSKDHLVYTDSGWKRIEEIVPGQDKIITYRYGTGGNVDPNRYNKIDGKWVQTWARQNRTLVAQRQSHKCAVTGELLERSFHLHHVEPRYERPDLAFDLNNVIAVNPDAHKDLHETQGWQIGVSLGSIGTLVDSVVSEGLCDTYDLEIAGEFPNFFADGVVVHNSRNASSSRAIPIKKQIRSIILDPAEPVEWGSARKGMQAGKPLQGWRLKTTRFAWHAAKWAAIGAARLALFAGAHKQIANRILEPWSHISVVVTATDWNNFFALRCHADADPTIRILADRMREARQRSTPRALKRGEWHLPYVDDPDLPLSIAIASSVARCARVSYLLHDGTMTSIDQDIELHDRLVATDPKHASPAEHQATPLPKATQRSGNFRGWQQYRKTLKNEAEPE